MDFLTSLTLIICFWKLNVTFFNRSPFVQTLMTSLADRLYRPYASSVSFELKVLAGILNSVRKPKSRREKDFLLRTNSSTDEDDPVAEKFVPIDRNASDVAAVVLRHLVREVLQGTEPYCSKISRTLLK